MLSQLTRCAKNLWARLSSAASQFLRCLTKPARPNLVTGTLAELPPGARNCSPTLACPVAAAIDRPPPPHENAPADLAGPVLATPCIRPRFRPILACAGFSFSSLRACAFVVERRSIGPELLCSLRSCPSGDPIIHLSFCCLTQFGSGDTLRTADLQVMSECTGPE